MAYLDNLVNAATSLLKNGLEALAGSLGLVGNAALDQVTVLVGRDLTRHKDVLTNLDSLALSVVLAMCARSP